MDTTENTISIFDDSAQEYQDRFMNFDSYNDTFDIFCNSIFKKDASILELACGPGNITKYLLKSRADFKILATDLSPKMLELAKNNNPSVTIKNLDCRNFKDLKLKFDGIMCGFALPYLSKEEAINLIGDAHETLHSGGVLYLSTMEDDYEKSGWRKSSSGKYEMYVNFHEANYLSEALILKGFKIVYLTRRDFVQHDKSVTTDLIVIAQK